MMYTKQINALKNETKYLIELPEAEIIKELLPQLCSDFGIYVRCLPVLEAKYEKIEKQFGQPTAALLSWLFVSGIENQKELQEYIEMFDQVCAEIKAHLKVSGLKKIIGTNTPEQQVAKIQKFLADKYDFQAGSVSTLKNALTKYFASQPTPIDPLGYLQLFLLVLDKLGFKLALGYKDSGNLTVKKYWSATETILSDLEVCGLVLSRTGLEFLKDSRQENSAFKKPMLAHKAEEYVRLGRELNKVSGEIYLNLGKIYFEQKKYKEALYNFGRAIEKSPTFTKSDYIDVEYTYSYCLAKLGRGKEAYNNLIELQKELKHEPEHLYKLGEYFEMIGYYQEAIKIFNLIKEKTHPDTQKIDEKIISCYYQVGDSYLNNGQIEEALKLFEQLPLTIDPSFDYKIGKYYFDRKKVDKAIEYFLKVLEKNPKHKNALMKLHTCYIFKKDFLKAAEIQKIFKR